MPIPNSTTVRIEASELPTWNPNALARSAVRPDVADRTMPMITMGSTAMMGLRKMSPSMSRIRMTVAIVMMVSAWS